MMAASPLFSATITTSHPRRTYIGPPSEYFLHSAITNKTCIPIIAITNQHHVLSTAAQPEPHHAPHTFHVPGQSHCACTSSRGHDSRSPQGLAVRATAERLSQDLAGDPKYIYKHKYDRKVHLAGDPKRKG